MRSLFAGYVPSLLLVGVSICLLLPGQAVATPSFHAMTYCGANPAQILAEDTQTSAPAEVEGWPVHDDWCCPWPNNTYYSYHHALAEETRHQTHLDLYVDGPLGGGGCGGSTAASSVFDVHFRCPDRPNEEISVAGNAWFRGHASGVTSEFGGWRASITTNFTQSPQVGYSPHVWHAYGSNGSAPNSGAFAGLPNSNDLDGIFTFDPWAVTLDANGEATLPVLMYMDLSVSAERAQVTTLFDGEDPGDLPRGMGFPIGSDVFVLPSGCTCDAPDVDIVDNQVPDVTGVGDEASSWGSLNSLSVFPSPMTSRCVLTYSVSRPSPVRLLILDAAGRRVASLLDRNQA